MHATNFREAIANFVRREALPPDKYSHQPRLYALCQEVGRDQIFDDDVLYAAVWTHDIGVFVGHRPEDPKLLSTWDNVGYAVRTVPGILEEMGFPVSKIPAVIYAIETHLPNKDPRSMEATILHDADILEQLGATGILRTMAKVGRDTRFITLHDAVSDLEQKARELPAKLRLPSSRRLALSRLEVMNDFFIAIASETQGVLA